VHSTIHAKPIDVWHGKTEPQQEFRTVDEKIEKKDGHRYLLEGKPGRWALYDLQVTKYPVSGNVVVSKRMRKENVRLSGYVKF
jgi:hypothetical protein